MTKLEHKVIISKSKRQLFLGYIAIAELQMAIDDSKGVNK